MIEKERQETIRRLKARLECDKRYYGGKGDICDPYKCEECDLCYEQGTNGERNIDLTRAIEALSEEAITIKWIKNYASHKASKDLIDCYWHFWEDDVLKMVAEWEKENGRSKRKSS